VFVRKFQKHRILSWFTPQIKNTPKLLKKKQENAQEIGGFVNPLLFLERIARISSYTIQAVKNAIITGKSLVDFMQALVAKLVLG